MVNLFRLVLAYPQFTEIRILQHCLEGHEALLQDLLPVRDKKDPLIVF